jgi:mxaJ protein
MSSAIKWMLASIICLTCTGYAISEQLRVCADPNNLPYSNQRRQGFENQIAALMAKDLGEELTYYWYPQRGKFFARTLESGVCDVVMGVPVGMANLDVTQPYYRSTYVFIARRDEHLHITSLDDPRLRTLKIGVHIFGDQNDSSPPADALIRRGLVHNLVGFSIFGNLNETNPPADLIRAVESHKVDVAIAWGPLAGYFSRHSSVPLQITPVADDAMNPELPFHFDIGIGVRKTDGALEHTLNSELVHLRPQIQEILHNYGIPQLSLPIEAARSKED